MAACSITAAPSAGFSSNISARPFSATTSTIRCWSWATCWCTKGPALRAQKEAAKIFGAERTYFVLNGTSASNKIVLSALVAPGDLVLFDRNNHKAAHHGALMLGGGMPIYLETDRNAQGMIGPIDYEALDEEKIRERSAPIRWSRTRTPGSASGPSASR